MVASAFMLVTIAVAVIVTTQFPRHRMPVHVRALVMLLMTLSIVGANLLYVRADAWQRTRALQCFAAGGLAGAGWLAVACVRGGSVDPGFPLAATTGVWLVSDLAFRMLPSMRADEDA